MSEITEKRQVYYIPDNYISESKLHIGQMTVRVRYLIDSLAMTAFLGIFALVFYIIPHSVKRFQDRLRQNFCAADGTIL